MGLVVVGLLFLIPIGSVLVWQQVRLMFASPLALVFHAHDVSNGDQIRHKQIRKFLWKEAAEANEMAKSAGFECKGLKTTRRLGVCYRDVWTGLCKDIWSLQLIFDNNKQIIQSSGRKRRVCLFR
ncbi:MAG: hypothetical protein HKN11_17865 [Rhizobiales bacterium]|nr:hypothetical protein [Hyphomicrobiales bacterium]